MPSENRSDAPFASIEAAELEALIERIINSGELGRSRTYGAILRYLGACSLSGETPKEAAIAVDVLGRAADFDVARDSIVRVHVYHLRSKLQAYFKRHGSQEKYRLEIPKGQYLLTSVYNDNEVEPPPASEMGTGRPDRRSPLLWTLATVALLLLANLGLMFWQQESPVESLHELGLMPPWNAIFDDQTPILVVVGDYYIFGELDERGDVERMVRDFDINSAADLDALFMADPEMADRYYNLGLSYLPVGTAPALMEIMPLLHDQGQRLSVKLVSELNASDLTANHVIYVGYISGMGILRRLMLAASGLKLGETYDELYNPDTDHYYVSDSGILSGPDNFRDFGMLSVFPSPRGNQIILIAGTRDAGLINAAQQITSVESLQRLEKELSASGPVSGQPENAFEALFEVHGFDHTNFDASLIYSKILDPGRIWVGGI
ncbi:MAG: hypothetical protein RQ899_08025 [Pseudomonadales bacterium]|nr:hypothetical protein [Pseudomonadales bacterium]